MERRRLTAVMLLGWVAVGACSRRRAATPVEHAASAHAVRVEWAGCAVVRVGPRCELGPDRKLTVWMAGEEASRWTFAADGRALGDQVAEPMQGGWRVTLEVPRMARRLSATRRAGGDEVWSLAVGDALVHADIDALVIAGKGGDPQAAVRLRQMMVTGDPRLQGPAQAGYGRVMLARGDVSAAEPALRQALAADRAEGRLSDEMREGSALIWALAVLQQRFADARAVLISLGTVRDQYPEGQARYAYSEGLLAVETDDLRTALASYRTAARSAERLARTGFGNDAAEDLAGILAMMGRSAEAVSILERLPSKDDPCALASLTINRVDALMAAAAGGKNADQTRVAVALSEEQRATSACLDPHRRLLAAVHAARHALSIGDRAAADQLVARLRGWSGAKDALAQAWRADVMGTWSLARGKATDAFQAFDEEAAIARAAGLRSEAFRGEVGAGEALLARGLRGPAIVRLKQAQALQQRTFQGIPIAEGRGEFLSSHDEGVRHLVDALVDGGAVAEAMAVARVARATEISHAAKQDRLRALSPQQRRQWDEALERRAGIRRETEGEALDDWKLSASALARARADREIRADQAQDALDAAYRLLVEPAAVTGPTLSPPRTGEVQIAFFPGVKDWIAFARTSTRTQARRFGDRSLDTIETASAVLRALSPALATAHRVLMFPFGRSDRVDWHAVAWRGAPLIATFDVEYGLDLPGVGDRARLGGVATSALVVANPTGDLRDAVGEGDLVVRSLAGWQVTRLDGPAATRDAVLKGLSEVGLLHYAGHAEMAGPSGASSALVLAGGARAQLGDLLSLTRLPDVVVLSACRAAASGATADQTASSMGLAQAFLAAGARAVVAPTRDVADADAQVFMARLYQTLAVSGLSALPESFRRAALDAVGHGAQSFRLIVQ